MNAEAQIEDYLAAVSARLSTVTSGEREQIVAAVSAQIRQSTQQPGATVDSVLARLGPPQKLADRHHTSYLVARASNSFMPPVLMHALMRCGLLGILASVIGVLCYWIGGGMLVFGLLATIWIVTHPGMQPAATALGIAELIGFGLLILFLTTIGMNLLVGLFKRRQQML